MSKETTADAVTQEVIRNYLESTADEMGVTMMRTAYSSILIAKDFSTGIFDAKADIVGQAAYIPVHIASMQYSVKWVVEEFGRENINPGDMIMHNDPFRGGTHIADTTIIRPIFNDNEEILGFAANRAHQIDLGGMAPGGFPGGATDPYQEGIRIPPIKVWDAGEEQDDLWKFLLSNVRVPRNVYGDMQAQIASNLTAEDRIHELIDRYSESIFSDACESLKDHSEELIRAEIEDLPDGQYSAVDYMDDDGISTDPVKIEVTVTVDGDEFIADFEGSAPQTEGGINCPWTVTAAGVYIALFHLTDPEIPFNAGCFRPVNVLAPSGTVVNADFPAPTFAGNTETSKRIIDVIIKAFEDATPERVAGANYGTSLNFSGGGNTDPYGEYAFLLFLEGGWGGRKTKDGITAVKNQISNTRNQPVEVFEPKYPFKINRYEIRDDSGGPGEYRGGLGINLEMELEGEIAQVNGMFDRCTISPWGVQGGKEAVPNKIQFRRAAEDHFQPIGEAFDTTTPSKFANLPISEGDTLLLQTAGGGGYGDPFDRDPERVQEDVRKGYVSPEHAHKDYGVEIDPETDEIIAVERREDQ